MTAMAIEGENPYASPKASDPPSVAPFENKAVLFPVLLCLGCILCGIYGALHNQISYSVSPDFFHFDLFDRFDTPEMLRNRLGASLVGWQGTWWMGFFVCIPVLLVGLILPGPMYITRCLTAFGIVAATALIVGISAAGYAASNPEVYSSDDWGGVMHNFGYLGGLLGISTGSAFLVWERARIASVAGQRSEEGLAETSEAQVV